MAKSGSYNDVEHIAQKPLAKRGTRAIGRGGRQVVVRKYGLSDVEVETYKAEFNGGEKIPNPFNRGTKYYILEALKALGADRNHSWTRFVDKFKELASVTKDENGKTFWQIFKGKAPRNPKTGLNWEGRLEQTVEVMQRTGGYHPYARPLLDLGSKVLGTAGIVIDVVYGSTGEVMIHLNTNSATPRNDTKRQPASPEQKAAAKAKVKAARAAKATKAATGTGKKRGRKPKVVTGAIPETAVETEATITETVPAETVPAETVPAEGEPTVEPIQEAVEPAVPVQVETVQTESTEAPVQDTPVEEVIQSEQSTSVTAEAGEVKA